MEAGAEGDIMTLLSANQPLPFCCYWFTLRDVHGATVLFKATVSHQWKCFKVNFNYIIIINILVYFFITLILIFVRLKVLPAFYVLV